MHAFVSGNLVQAIGAMNANATLRKDMPLGEAAPGPLYQMWGYGATTHEDLVGDVVERSALEDFVNGLRQGSTCYIEHERDRQHVLGVTAKDFTITSCKPGRYGRFQAEEPFDALEVTVNVSPYNPLAQQAVMETLFGVPSGFSPLAHILDKELRKTRDGQRHGWKVLRVQPYEITNTVVACNPTAFVEVMRKSLQQRAVFTDNPAENAYHLKHGQDHDDDVAAMLYQIAHFLKRHNLTLPDLTDVGGET